MNNNASFRYLALFCYLLLTACGSPDPQGAETMPADEVETEGKAATSATLDDQGFINSFSLSSTGAVDTSWVGGKLSFTGGCSGSSPLSMGFRSGLPTASDYQSVAFDSEAPIGTGATGPFPLKEIRWDDGIVTQTVAGGLEVQVPNRLTGSGTITIDSHTGTVASRHMTATVTGDVTDESGRAASLAVEFDINWSCGVSM